MPSRLPHTKLASIVIGSIAVALIGGGAAVAQRAGVVNLPFAADSSERTAQARAADEGTEEGTGEDADPIEPASSVTTSSTGDSPPAVEAVIDGTQGTNGWYTTEVALQWTVTDEETPEITAEGCEPATVSEDTDGQTFSCTATSEGGSTTTIATIAKDATAPGEVSVTAEPSATNGWHAAPFTATWTGSDAISGIAECTSTDYAGPDAVDATLIGTCTDHAGNKSDAATYAFSYDATAPIVSAVPDRAPDHNGWYNRGLTVAWTSDDADATCDPDTTYDSGDAEDITVTGGCTDPAGNRGTASYTFDFDATAPIVSILSPAAATYILNQPVTVTISCTDATAGVESCVSNQPSGNALDTASVGSKSVVVEATDRAGNTARARHDYAVTYSPVGVSCGGVAGHQILQPIRADGSGSVNGNSTVPAKFRVCDFFGRAVTTAGVVQSFRITQVDGGAADAAVPSTSSHEQFRAGDSQWIFNISTKPLRKGSRYGFTIALDDGTTIPFSFAIR